MRKNRSWQFKGRRTRRRLLIVDRDKDEGRGGYCAAQMITTIKITVNTLALTQLHPNTQAHELFNTQTHTHTQHSRDECIAALAFAT